MIKRNVFFLYLSISEICFDTAVSKLDGSILTIGYLVPWEQGWLVGPHLGSAVMLGIKEVEKRQLLPGYHLKWEMRDTYCEPRRGMQMAMDLWFSEDIDVFIGPACSVVCEPVSLLSAAWGIPVISWACSGMSLSDKHAHPTFSRAAGSSLDRIPPIASVPGRFGWNRTCIITTPQLIFKSLAEELFKEIQQQGQYVVLQTVESAVRGTDIIADKVQNLKNLFTSFINKFSFIVLLTYPIDMRIMLISAYDVGLLNGDYAFLTLEYTLTIMDTPQTYRPDVDDIIYDGLLALGPSWPSGGAWDNFRQDVIDMLQDSRFDYLPHIPAEASVDDVDNYAGLYYNKTTQV